MDEETKAFLTSLFRVFENRQSQTDALIQDLKESFERGIHGLREDVHGLRDRLDRMETRLDKIASGAHYVSRLVEWSEKQDHFQLDILERVRRLEGWVQEHRGPAPS